MGLCAPSQRYVIEDDILIQLRLLDWVQTSANNILTKKITLRICNFTDICFICFEYFILFSVHSSKLHNFFKKKIVLAFNNGLVIFHCFFTFCCLIDLEEGLSLLISEKFSRNY